MATVGLTTSPATLDGGSSEFVNITNSGAFDVTVTRGSQSFVLRPGQSRQVYPEGVAVTATVASGTGQVTTSAQATQVTQAQQVAANTAAIAGLPGTYVPAAVVLPSGDATGATDTAAIQAAHANLPATGGRIYLAAGSFYLNAALSLTKPVRLEGAGGALVGDASLATPKAITTIYAASATADGLAIAADGCTISDLAVVNTATTPTAGAGIHVTAGEFTRITRVSVVGFYNNIQFDDGFYYNITDCTVLDPVNYGAYLRNAAAGEYDHGDWTISGTVFTSFFKTRNAASAVRWESGGGLKFANNKINGATQPGNSSAGRFAIGLDIAVADSVATSDFQIVGNSIENCTSHAISISNATSGTLANVTVVGNQFLSAGIWMSMASAGQLTDVMVASNVFGTFTVTTYDGIYFKNVTGATVGVNQFKGCPGSNGVVHFDTGCLDYACDTQTVRTSGYTVIDHAANSAGPFNRVHKELVRAITGVTSTSTYTNLLTIVLPAFTGGLIEVVLAGNGTGAGGFSGVYRRAFARQSSNSTLTTVGTDTTVNPGAADVLDIQFSASGANITIGLRLNPTTAASAATGSMTVRVDGNVTALQKL